MPAAEPTDSKTGPPCSKLEAYICQLIAQAKANESKSYYLRTDAVKLPETAKKFTLAGFTNNKIKLLKRLIYDLQQYTNGSLDIPSTKKIVSGSIINLKNSWICNNTSRCKLLLRANGYEDVVLNAFLPEPEMVLN